MHNKKKCILYAVIVLCAIACAASARDKASATDEAVTAKVHGNNLFALKLYKQLSAAEGNLFFSPYSVRTALGMTYAGAKGQTAKQMESALNFALKDTALHKTFADSINALNTGSGCSYEMNIANSLWIEKTRSFLKPFMDINEKSYGGVLERVDFIHNAESAREKINVWVEKQTRQKIRNLIPPGGVNADTRLALVNAVYFKGRWDEEFDKKLTRVEPFYCTDERIVETELMTFSKPEMLPFFAGDGIKIVELDYFGGAVSMIILLPDTPSEFSKIEQSLDETQLTAWLGSLQKKRVRVHLPRFSITWGAENLAPHLRALGMQDAFVRGTADFSGIDGTRELVITGAFHKAFVDVNEKGTEAAAATGVMVGVTSMPPPPEIFRADHPFLFLIREKKAGTILFMGRMTEPQ